MSKAKVVLLFLAHREISQPLLWKKWIKETEHNKDEIALLALVASEKKLPKPWYQIIATQNTAWCEDSLFFAMLTGLRYALDKFPEATTFYLISGDTVPLVKATALLNETRLGKTVLCPSDLNLVKKDTSSFASKFPTSNLKPISFSHHQWIALSRKDATTLVHFKEYDTLKAWFSKRLDFFKTLMEENQPGPHPLLYLTKKRREQLKSLSQWNKKEKEALEKYFDWSEFGLTRPVEHYACPDEYYPYWILTNESKDFKNHSELCPLMNFFMPTSGASPVTWNKLEDWIVNTDIPLDLHHQETDQDRSEIVEKIKQHITNLREQLHKAHMASKIPLFYRKISPEVSFNKKLPWADQKAI